MHFKIAQSLLVAGLAVSVCGMGIVYAAGVALRGEYLRGSCQVISALSAFFLFRHLRDQQKRRESKTIPLRSNIALQQLLSAPFPVRQLRALQYGCRG